MTFIVLLGGSIFVIDQITKALVLRSLSAHESIPIIPHVLNFTLVKNTGIAFGFFKNYTAVAHILVFIGCILLILIMYKSHSLSRCNKIACGFMLGGAVGNLVDRVRFGAVIDFIDFQIWPVFNIADTFISVAAGLFIISLMKKDK